MRRWETPLALERKPGFWDGCLAMDWMWDFQVRLDEAERSNSVKEGEMSSSLPFMRTGGKFWLCLREMTVCLVLLWLNETRLSSPHFSVTVKSLERREAEMFLWSWISVEAWSFGLNEIVELRKVSSAKEWMLEDVEVSRSLIECRLEKKPSTLTAIDLSERKLPIHLIRVWWRPNMGILARGPLCQTWSKALEISRLLPIVLAREIARVHYFYVYPIQKCVWALILPVSRHDNGKGLCIPTSTVCGVWGTGWPFRVLDIEITKYNDFRA